MSQDPVNKSSAVTFPNQENELLPELTQRQQQILALIKAGKVNKEIANELGIGLGTVKQHVVALFKKLHVSNRAMAVSQGISQAPESQPESAQISEGILERRPCIVLSILLPGTTLKAGSESSPKAVIQELHQTFSALAAAYDALFLANKTCIGDLIFGIKCGTEQDIFKALHAAYAVFEVLTDYPNLMQDLRGGLAAGFAISSMNRHGGWSGEVVASSVIAYARELASNATPGQLALGALAAKLLKMTGPDADEVVAPYLLFNTLDRMPWGRDSQSAQAQVGDSEESGTEILGREAELERLEIVFSDVFRRKKTHLVFIEGETGMGKSLLCRHVAQRGRNLNGRVHHFVCHSGGKEGSLYLYPSGMPVKPQTLLHCLKTVTGRGHDVVIVDDAHLLPLDILIKVTETARAAKEKMVILAARKFSKYVMPPSETIRLGHLPRTDMENLVVQSLGLSEKGSPDADMQHSIAAIVQYASGVPLFAIELARHQWEDALPFSLQVVINARMDGLKLDRALLRQVSKTALPMTVAEIAEAMWESPDAIQMAVEQACASGVLWLNEQGQIAFAHPLLQMLVDQSGVE
jgi:DNA-binding CsgD family transcriptional regulator